MIIDTADIECAVSDAKNVLRSAKMLSKDHHLSFVKYPKPLNLQTQYGTAGFRMKVGVLAALLAKKRRKNIGVMITASHNPEEDNGIKIVEPTGEMLAKNWEEYATELANCRNDVNQFNAIIQSIASTEVIDENSYCTVILGCDTRKSSLALCNALSDGVKYVQRSMIIDYGFVTTPELHFFVGESNKNSFVCINEESYFGRICGSFKDFIEYCCIHKNAPDASSVVSISAAADEESSPKTQIFVDCANGVGGGKMLQIAALFNESSAYVISPFNVGDGAGEEKSGLNDNCGADFVKLNKQPPVNCPAPNLDAAESSAKQQKHALHYCSIDGDADRLVYFYFKDGAFCLLDGDKIAALFCFYLSRLFNESGIQCSIGVVQTAYANGKSTEYFEKTLNAATECVLTGVKNLHEAAKAYDVGIYFEANGHGTIVVKKEFQHFLEKKFLHCPPSSKEKRTISKILLFFKIINSYVGDAISDLLVVEAILYDCGLSLEEWDAFYTDRPSRQTKIRIANKDAFKTVDADRKLSEPKALQEFIDQTLVLHGHGARCFVRPSGTEDIIRLYVEAAADSECDTISQRVRQHIVDKYAADAPK